MADNREVALRLTGDASSLTGALNAAEQELLDFERVGKQISILENAVANVGRFEAGIVSAQARVRQLQAAYSEALNANADAPALKKLESQLKAAEKEADKAAKALERSQAAVVKLNLAAGAAGVNTGNLAERKAQLAAETDKARAKVDALNVSLQQASAAERNLAAGANSVNSAFATLNIRSAEKIRADIEAVNQALVRLAGNSKVSGADFDRAYAGAQTRLAALRAELSGTEAAAGKTSTAVSGLGVSLGGLAAGIGLAAVGREFVTANVAAESLERTLVQLTGSGSAAAAEVEYLKTTADRLGLSVQDASRAYVSLTASAKGTSLEGAGTRQVFEAVAGAMSKLGKSSADTEGALQAVSQMIGKGTVSMEEMRQQLAERLPGAMQATADAVGVTVGELTEMISSGQVLASDLLPKLAEGLQKMYGTAGQAEGSIAAWNRLKNAVAETFTFVGNSGAWSGLVAILGQAATAVRGLAGAFELLGKIAGISLAAIATFDWRRPIESVKNWKAAIAEAADDIQARLDKAKASTEGTAQAQQRLAVETGKAGAAAQQGALSWLAVVNAYAKVGAAAKEGVETAVKSAAARAEEGKASVALAQAFAGESDKRVAALSAAKNDAEALRAVADARRLEAEVARSNLVALQESTRAEGALTEEKRKQISAVEQSATVKQAEADQAAAASLAAQQRAAALATETAMIQDNSARLGELKAAHDAAAVAMANTSAARVAGVATMAQEQTAAIAAGQAAALYRDALNDQTRALEYNAKVKQSKTDLAAAGLRLQIEEAKTLAEVAKAYGDEATAASALIQVKQLEIELAELQAQAKRAEAESSLAIAHAKRAELQASGNLTVEKEREIKAQELAAQVKFKEAEISEAVADRMRQLVAATAEGASSAESAAGSYDRLAGSLDGVASSAGRAADGVRTASGTSLGKIGGSQVDFTETLYRRGASVQEQRLAQKYVGELYQRNQATMLTGNLGTDANAARLQKMAIEDAVDKAIAAARRELATGKAVDLGTSVNELMARNLSRTSLRSFEDMSRRIRSAGAEASGQVIKVDLRTDKKTTAVNVASDKDAAALIDTLKSLQARSA